MTGTAPPRDPAAQPERTDLAWRRTALAFAAVALFAWRAPTVSGGATAVSLTAAALCAAAWVVFLLAARGRLRLLRARQPAAVAGGRVLVAAGAVLATAAGGLLLVLLG
ncbi:DUF202 domain-containing protein [Streptomyces sp. SM14]|uniref:DUF202 domain-containing protein n=1 Tax=Streptomyces sp. SM14 TaxID=1736045 RepID=UPI000CD4D705|nr:DUF202 domain-containing protein [Streptomyces sp. SM14]